MSSGKKTGKKGFETEEVVRSYFLAAGFFVVRGVKLRNGGDELTDIDLQFLILLVSSVSILRMLESSTDALSRWGGAYTRKGTIRRNSHVWRR